MIACCGWYLPSSGDHAPSLRRPERTHLPSTAYLRSAWLSDPQGLACLNAVSMQILLAILSLVEMYSFPSVSVLSKGQEGTERRTLDAGKPASSLFLVLLS